MGEEKAFRQAFPARRPAIESGRRPAHPFARILVDAKAGEVLRYLLDTNILSELRKPKPHGAVLAWFTAFHSAGFAIPVLALFEMQTGVEQLKSKDPFRAAAFEFWISRLEAADNVLPFDASAAREAARLLYGKPGNLLAHGMIAAIARVHGLTIATRNTRDFEQFDVPLANPFEYRS